MSARWRHDDETGEVPPEHAPEPAAGLAAKGEPPLAAKGEPQLAATGEGLAASSAASKGASLSSWPRRDGRHDRSANAASPAADRYEEEMATKGSIIAPPLHERGRCGCSGGGEMHEGSRGIAFVGGGVLGCERAAAAKNESGVSSRSLGEKAVGAPAGAVAVAAACIDAPTPAEGTAAAGSTRPPSRGGSLRNRRVTTGDAETSGTVHGEAPLLLDAPAVGARHALKSGDREPREREPPENGTGCRPCSRGRFAPGPLRDVPSSPSKPASCAASDPDNTLPSGFGGRFAERGDASCAGSSLSPCEPPLISMFASSSSRSSARTGGGFFMLGGARAARPRLSCEFYAAVEYPNRNSY